MAWNLPATPNPGDVATVANFAVPVIDSLTYLHDLPRIAVGNYTGTGTSGNRAINRSDVAAPQFVAITGRSNKDFVNNTMWVVQGNQPSVAIPTYGSGAFSWVGVYISGNGVNVGGSNDDANYSGNTYCYIIIG